DRTWTAIGPIPEKVGDTPSNLYPGEAVVQLWIVHDVPNPLVRKHFGAKVIETLAASKPARRRDHENVARVKRDGALYEVVVHGRRACSMPTIVDLVRWVANDHVELHFRHLLRRVRPVNE